MTDEQRKKIQSLRAEGYGYGKISELIGLPVNTVKSYCRRHGFGGAVALDANAPTGEGHYCKYCGGEIKQNPGRKEKKFCSDRCRNKWWNSHLELVDRRANYECTCHYCGKTFISYGKKERKYCSHDCYSADRFGGGTR